MFNIFSLNTIFLKNIIYHENGCEWDINNSYGPKLRRTDRIDYDYLEFDDRQNKCDKFILYNRSLEINSHFDCLKYIKESL